MNRNRLKNISLLGMALCLSYLPSPAHAQESTHPLRDFSPNRPGATLSSHTIDAGHFLIESELLGYTYHRSAGFSPTDGSVLTSIDKTFSFNNFLITYGLTDQWEFALGLPNFLSRSSVVDSLAGRNTQNQTSVSDLSPRLKVSVFGNESGAWVGALVTTLRLPTHTGNLGTSQVDGGVSFPLSVTLPDNLSLTLMPEIDERTNDSGIGYHAEVVVDLFALRSLTPLLDGYVQLTSLSSLANTGASSWQATAGVGAAIHLGKNTQLDFGINLGLTAAADDFNPLVGIATRY